MIENATITAIAPPPTVSNKGGRTESAAVSMSVRCFVDEPRRATVLSKANVIADAQAHLFAPGLDLETQLVEQARVTFTIDGCASRTLQVAWAQPRVKAGGLSHVEAILKTV